MADALTLHELQQRITDAVSDELSGEWWVRAEIASLSTGGGHCYIDLTESADGKPVARARAVVWKYLYAHIGPYFHQVTGRELEAGMQVLLQVEVSYHALYGVTLVVQDIDPAYTVGEEALRRRRTLERLQEEGVLEMNRQLPVPDLICRVAVVSSATAAGYDDFCHELQSNEYGYTYQFTLFPALMQGEGCPDSVTAALDAVAEHAETFDLVVIIRGGGAVSDLSAFDDYRMAAHVAQFPLPVWSGIGHNRDVSVLDLVSNASWKTPTATAQAIVAHTRMAEERILALRNELDDVIKVYLERESLRLEQLAVQLPAALEGWLQRQQQRLESVCSALEHLDPQRVLERGYAEVRRQGRPVVSAGTLKPGLEVEIRFSDGIVKAQIL